MSVTVDHGDEIPLRCHRIEVRIRKLSQLFDSLDPSPFLAKDLDPDAGKSQQQVIDEMTGQLNLFSDNGNGNGKLE